MADLAAALAATMAEADLSTYGGRFQDLPGEIQERLIRQKMGDATAAVAYLREHLTDHAEELGMRRDVFPEYPPVYDGGSLISAGGPRMSRHVTNWRPDDRP